MLHRTLLAAAWVALWIALGLPTAALAQLTLDWMPRDDLNPTLPDGITVFEATSTSPAIKAWYVRADLAALADSTWTVRALLSDEGTEPVTAFAEDADAFVAINGGYFGGGQSFSLVAEGGDVVTPNIKALTRGADTYYPTRGAFGLLEGSPMPADVAWIYDVDGTQYAYPQPSPNTQAQAQPQPDASFPDGGAPWPVVTGIGGGPVLVENGQPMITWEEEVFFGSGIGAVSDFQPRTALGYTAAGDLLLMVVDGRQGASRGVSLTELADLMIDLNAVEALNLDGGGSSTLTVGTTLINRPEGGTAQRPVASALLLAPPAAAEQDTTSLFFDTGDACCYRETGDWFASANTPFYGGTEARLNAAGTGADRAVFTFVDIETDRYTVDAWWVPSTVNRATDTPYTIYHGGDSTTVRVDQTDPATLGQWNRLGTFDLAAGDSVVVTDDASGPADPSFVVVDAIRLQPATSTARDDAPATPSQAPLTVYPNPSRGLITLVLAQHTTVPVRGTVVDLLGRVVHRFEGPAARHQEFALDLSSLAAGLYVIRVQASDGWCHQPVILH